MSTEKCWSEKIAETDFDFKESRDLIREALEDYTNKICEAINPIDTRDLIFIIAALKTVVKYFSQSEPEENAVSEILLSHFKAVEVRTHVPENATQEDIDRMKEQFFKN